VARIGVADEGEAADAGHEIVAPRASLDERGVEVARQGTEPRAVEVEAAHLPAECVDLVADVVAGEQREPLHRVEVHVEAGETTLGALVQDACAEDGGLRVHDVDAACLELQEGLRAVEDDGLVGEEAFLGRAPAEIDMMRGARTLEVDLAVDRERPEELGGGLGIVPCTARDRPRPRFAERAVLEGDERLRVPDALCDRAFRLRGGEREARLVDAREDRGDDERAEARAHPVLVDPEDEGLLPGFEPDARSCHARRLSCSSSCDKGYARESRGRSRCSSSRNALSRRVVALEGARRQVASSVDGPEGDV
jgi:hypothetical protein